MMKKQWIFALALFMTISLCACAAQETAQPPDSTPQTDLPVQSESVPSESDNGMEQPSVPMKDGIPLHLEDYIDLTLAQHDLTRDQLCYSVTELATGTVTELDHSQRLLGGFQCRAVTPPEGERLFADAGYALRIATPDGTWYLEYHDGAHADYLYFPEYDRYVQLYYPGGGTAEQISAVVQLYAQQHTLTAEAAYTGAVVEGAPAVEVREVVCETFQDALGTVCTRRLPEILLGGVPLEDINADILQCFPVEGMGEHTWTDVTYRWSVSGDVLSVLVVGTNVYYGGFDALGCVTCKVYNISVSQRRLLSNDELYTASGVADVRERVAHAIVCRGAAAKAAALPGAFQDAYEVSVLRACIMAEVSDLNFVAAQPCLDENGQLCVVALLYTGLGNGRYWDYICVEDWDMPVLTSSSAYYACFAALYGA